MNPSLSPNQNTNMGIHPSGGSSGASTSSPPTPPLQRGKACLACRRRKVKCDGVRPVCTPCLRGERAEDCEYTDGARRPRTLMLEENITRLRARVQELEHPEEASPSVGLHDPYAGAGSAISVSASAIDARLQAPSPVSFQHAIGRRQGPSSEHASGSATDPHQVYSEADTHLHARRSLSVIPPHAAELGFFLDPDRLRLQGTHILPALRSILTLWSLHIASTSEPDHAQAYERTAALRSTLLSQSQTQFAEALNTIDSESDPTVFLHVIQTGVLLAYYMQRVGQVIGAKYYASGTWSLVITLKLYRRSDVSVGAREGEGQAPQAGRAQQGLTSENTDMDTSTDLFAFARCSTRLAPALDSIEAEERVRAFWTVYGLDRWFGAVCKAPCQSLGSDGSAGSIMTVQWPGVRGTNFETRTNVVQRFLNDLNHDFTQEGVSSIHAKVSVLLGEATGIAASCLTDRAVSQSPAFRARFATLDTLIQRCSSAAMVMVTAAHGRQPPQTQEQSQAFVTVHLAALAQVSLHQPWISTYGLSRQRCIEAALSVVRVLDQLGEVEIGVAGSITPIYAIVWTALCLSLHDQVLQLRARPDTDPSRRHEEGEMMRAIRKLVGPLSELSQNCPSQFFAANIEAVLSVLESITG